MEASTMPWQPKRPTVSWVAPDPALPPGREVLSALHCAASPLHHMSQYKEGHGTVRLNPKEDCKDREGSGREDV